MLEALRRAWAAAPPAPDPRSILDAFASTRDIATALDLAGAPPVAPSTEIDPLRLAAIVRVDALERRRRGMSWGLDHYRLLFPAHCGAGGVVSRVLFLLEFGLGESDIDSLRSRFGDECFLALHEARAEKNRTIGSPAEPETGSSGSWLELSADAGPLFGALAASPLASPTADHRAGLPRPPGGPLSDRDSSAPGRLFAPRKGQRIGPYVLRRRLGDGGFGEVWMADRRSPDMTVAVKLLLPGRDMPGQRARFEAEAQALARLSHECIARIIDFSAGAPERSERAVGSGEGESRAARSGHPRSSSPDGIDIPHLVMEFIEGEPITAYCDRRRFSLAQRLELVARVADAIHHAHSRQLIHRDLKPANILVTEYRCDPEALRGREGLLVADREGNQAVVARPKIVDFGLVKSLDANVRLADGSLSADFGKLIGTLEYMAPEQVQHDPLAVDTRADIFALGVVLYELVAGVRPISSDELRREAIDAAIAKVRNMPRPEASTRFSTLDRETAAVTAQRRGEANAARLSRVLGGRLRHLAGTALRMEKERRFSSAAAFARDIRRYLDNEPFEEAAAEPLSRTLWLAIRRRPLPYAAAAAVAMTVLAALVAVTLLGSANAALATRERAAARNAQTQLERAETSAAAEEAARELAEARAEEAERQRDVARDLARVATAWIEAPDDPALRAMILREITESRNDWIVDRAVIGAAWSGAARVARFWHDDAVHSIEWSSDGRRFATVTASGRARLWRIEAPESPVELIGRSRSVRSLTWSPDGSCVATASAGTAHLWRVDQPDTPVVLTRARSIVSVGWSPVGSQLVTGSVDGSHVWRGDQPEPVVRFGVEQKNVYAMVWSPDGSRVATMSSRDEGLSVWESSARDEPKLLLRVPGLKGQVAWSPDGTRLAVLSWGTPTFVVAPDPVNAWGYYSAEGRLRVWRLGIDAAPIELRTSGRASSEQPVASNGSMPREIDSPTGTRLTCMAWSSDGSQIAAGGDDGQAYVWTDDFGKPPIVLARHESSVRSVAWSPDQNRLATASDDGSVRVWRVQSRSDPSVLRGHRGSVRVVAWSPDGRWLATASGDRTVGLWRADDIGAPRMLSCPVDIECWGLLAWSPDRSHVLQAIDDGTIRVWSTEPGVDPVLLQGHGARVLAAAWSPDGELVATASNDGRGSVWSIDPETPPVALEGHRDWIRALAWSPDGSSLATASDDGTARIWSRHPGVPSIVLGGHDGWVRCVAWSPDGTRVATGCDDAMARVYSTAPGSTAPGIEPVLLRGHEKPIAAIAWSPDGLRIATGAEDATVRIFSTIAGVDPIVLRGHADSIRAVAWSAEGDRIATASDDGTVRVWLVDSGLAPLTLDAKELPLLSVAWSADGRSVLAQSNVGTMLEWDLSLPECRERLWSETLDLLTPVERARYFGEGEREAGENHARQRAARDDRLRARPFLGQDGVVR